MKKSIIFLLATTCISQSIKVNTMESKQEVSKSIRLTELARQQAHSSLKPVGHIFTQSNQDQKQSIANSREYSNLPQQFEHSYDNIPNDIPQADLIPIHDESDDEDWNFLNTFPTSNEEKREERNTDSTIKNIPPKESDIIGNAKRRTQKFSQDLINKLKNFSFANKQSTYIFNNNTNQKLTITIKQKVKSTNSNEPSKVEYKKVLVLNKTLDKNKTFILSNIADPNIGVIIRPELTNPNKKPYLIDLDKSGTIDFKTDSTKTDIRYSFSPLNIQN